MSHLLINVYTCELSCTKSISSSFLLNHLSLCTRLKPNVPTKLEGKYGRSNTTQKGGMTFKEKSAITYSFYSELTNTKFSVFNGTIFRFQKQDVHPFYNNLKLLQIYNGIKLCMSYQMGNYKYDVSLS